MKLVTYLEDSINDLIEKNLSDYKIKKIKNQSLLLFSNDQYKIDELELENEMNTFGNIDINGDKFIFDLLKEIKFLFYSKGIYYSESKDKKVSKIDPIKLNGVIYKEIIKILINKLSRKYNSKDIIILDYRFDENYKIESYNYYSIKKIKLNEEEKKTIKAINFQLNRIINAFHNLFPGVNVIKIDNAVFMMDFKNREFKFNDGINNIIIENLKKYIEMKRFKNEKTFPSVHPIRYYFEEAKKINKDKLIIVFSSFSTSFPKYNYINTLKAYDCNKLFILDDYGSKGTYYLGIRGEFNIDSSVISLITHIISKYNILFNNVISIGTSKGGSAAIYYGMKYNFGTIIAGAPQYKIGTYLSDLSIKKYALEIFGGINDANKIKYDNTIRLVSNIDSKVYILTSDGDNQYKKLLKEYEYIARELEINLTIEKCEINNHGEIAREFPKFLYNKLDLILDKKVINFNEINKKTINFKSFLYKYILKFGGGKNDKH